MCQTTGISNFFALPLEIPDKQNFTPFAILQNFVSCSIQLVCLASQTCLVGNYQGDAEKNCVEENMHDRQELSNNIVTRNRKKSGNTGRTGRSVRTKLYYNPFFFTGHQNVNNPKSRAVRTVYGLIFLPFYKIIVSFFLFYVNMQTKQDQTVL